MQTDGLAASFLEHQVELIVGDVKEVVSRVSDGHFVEADNLTVPAITYEVRIGEGSSMQEGEAAPPRLLYWLAGRLVDGLHAAAMERQKAAARAVPAAAQPHLQASAAPRPRR